MSAWAFDATVPNRAAAINRIRSARLPFFAEEHLISLVKRENYTHTGYRNPDKPFRLTANGYDHGSYIGISHCRLEYTQ